ncbi:MAG: ROK family protein [Prevotella sp.]|nr:ROK family protein [Prevotella sp.]
MGDIKVKNRVVGVDISTRTTYAIVDIRGNIIAEDGFETYEYPNVNDFVAKLADSILELVVANGGYESIRSIGISSPSASIVTGCIVNAPNLPWKGVVPLAAMLRDRLGLAVAMANDAHISALGEKAYGSAHGMRDFVIINIGVGLGSCFFSANHEHQGAGGFAGEIGHTCIDDSDSARICACGKRGCLEAYCGAKGIIRTAEEVMAESDKPSLMRGQEQLSPKMITEFCEQGDELAIEVYRRTGYKLGIGMANYASIIDPEAIILTGGISKAGKWLIDPAYESFDKHVFGNIRGKVKIILSMIDNRERDVLGASALAWSQKEYSLFK